MSDSKIVLYSFWESSCAWRVRSALNLKQIPYEIRTIDLLKTGGGEQYSNEFKQINPMGQVPALIIDGHTLIESMAIMEYLEQTRLSHPLLPQDALERARVRAICEIVCSGIQPLQNTAPLKYLGAERSQAWAQHWVQRGFEALEKILATTAGKYCVGDELTLADCCLVPQVYNARIFELDLTPFPNIVRIDGHLSGLPAFINSHPSSQPDAK